MLPDVTCATSVPVLVSFSTLLSPLTLKMLPEASTSRPLRDMPRTVAKLVVAEPSWPNSQTVLLSSITRSCPFLSTVMPSIEVKPLLSWPPVPHEVTSAPPEVNFETRLSPVSPT